MGYIRHHTIVVTGNIGPVTNSHKKAVSIFGSQVSEMLPVQINATYSFFIGPDGSKEGWDDSDNGDKRRACFIEYLRKSNNCSWVEVEFGGDGSTALICSHSKMEQE